MRPLTRTIVLLVALTLATGDLTCGQETVKKEVSEAAEREAQILRLKIAAMETKIVSLESELQGAHREMTRYEKELQAADKRADEMQRRVEVLMKQAHATQGRQAKHSGNTAYKNLASTHRYLTDLAALRAERRDFEKAVEYQQEAINLAKSQELVGIGVAIGAAEGIIRVSDVLPSTPASGSGLQRGDIIEAIDGVSTKGMSQYDVADKIRGPRGTKVTLTVKHSGQEMAEHITVTRDVLGATAPSPIEYEWRLAAYKAGKTYPEYRRMTEKPKAPAEDIITQVMEVKYADCERLAQTLLRLLSDKQLRIVADDRTNTLVAVGSKSAIEKIKALIAELDKAGEEETVCQVLKLKYADCERVAKTVANLLLARPTRAEPVTIVPDSRLNQLMVRGTEQDLQTVKALVAELDAPSEENVVCRVIKLKQADCESVAKMLANLFAATRATEPLTMVAHSRLNQLMVRGTEQDLQSVEALIEQLDQPE